MEANYMSISRGAAKADVMHTQNGILLSHKKEENNAICSNADGPHFTVPREVSQRKATAI